jgi:putative spermidine/putrescine transport system ATP-binding protein
MTTVHAAGTGTGEAGATPAAISVRSVTKRFGPVVAVNDVSLDIAAGEFFSLLGPSGSGKTTMLRMIAGFEQPTEGRIMLGGTDVTMTPPFDRDVNTVFQDYALFPHMSVANNVEYGLKVKRVPKAERRSRVAAALTTVRLEGYGDRRPHQLSGGQRQRVALARALVNRPRVLLLDEPLGALDRKLREEMQVELKQIQRDVGITFVFVTHDQAEALAMSNRIAVFDHGRIEQVGAPAEIYEKPATEFVAGFVGTSNVLEGAGARAVLGVDGAFTVRPEKIRLLEPGAAVADDEVTAAGTLGEVQYLGSETRYRVVLDAGPELIVEAQNLDAASDDSHAARGRPVRLAFRREHAFSLERAAVPTTDSTTDHSTGEHSSTDRGDA